jgi:hypothetical protein
MAETKVVKKQRAAAAAKRKKANASKRRKSIKEDFAGDALSRDAFHGMSFGDRLNANTPLIAGALSGKSTEKQKRDRNRNIRNVAGAPGAFTTQKGGDIKNRRSR